MLEGNAVQAGLYLKAKLVTCCLRGSYPCEGHRVDYLNDLAVVVSDRGEKERDVRRPRLGRGPEAVKRLRHASHVVDSKDTGAS